MARVPDYVPITEEEFLQVYEAIWRNTTPYLMEEVSEIVAQMREARFLLDEVMERAGLEADYLYDKYDKKVWKDLRDTADPDEGLLPDEDDQTSSAPDAQ